MASVAWLALNICAQSSSLQLTLAFFLSSSRGEYLLTIDFALMSKYCGGVGGEWRSTAELLGKVPSGTGHRALSPPLAPNPDAVCQLAQFDQQTRLWWQTED